MPGCPIIVRDSAFIHYRARRFDEAARLFRDWGELEPAKPDPVQRHLAAWKSSTQPREQKLATELVRLATGLGVVVTPA